ncbi:helix-turn-helix domain-containing protein [Aquamicrobium defluvii]|uniref:helix-turn-helix domain-containing protein n=1 Tax=Aquamicrobium defluvii TaxID=69279 RepID=UPI0012EB1DA7|nr:helix-turn-helix transcriptional regulator [Aquamicrobium defluvii]
MDRIGEFVRAHRFIKKNEEGIVNNPLRSNIAAFLESERGRRNLFHQDMAALLRSSHGEGLSYRTYIQTCRQNNNVTLRTLEFMAAALEVSIATMLAGDAKIDDWVHALGDDDIRRRLADIINEERSERGLLRKEMAALLGVAQMTYTKLERGQGNISVDTIAGIAGALGRDPATFLFCRDRKRHKSA